MDFLNLLLSENRVVEESFRKPTIEGGDNDDFYPLVWRVMRLVSYQRFLKKHVFDFDGMGVYYFLNYHTSLQAALHFRSCVEHSKGVPVASNLGEAASSYSVLVGISSGLEGL